MLGGPRADSLQRRQAETIRLTNLTEADALREATQVLLDLGFAIDEASSEFGVLAGSKERDATEAGAVAAAIALTVVAAVFLVAVAPVWDTDQTIRVTLTARQIQVAQVDLRVSFERRVKNNQGASRYEDLNDPQMYQEFFTLLRQGVGRSIPS